MICTKELIITCAGGVKGLLDVSENDTLADIQNQVDDELDHEDLILPNFAFRINGDIRISEKQEKKKRAWDLIDRNLSICSKGRSTSKRNYLLCYYCRTTRTIC